MPKIFFRNEKTNKRYRVVALDKEAGEVTLRGEMAEFTEKYDKDRFKKLGYVLEKVPDDEDDEDAIQPKLRA